MSIATPYGAHGNLPALEAALAEIPDGAAIVAGGAQPAETLERPRSPGERVVRLRGDADREPTPGDVASFTEIGL